LDYSRKGKEWARKARGKLGLITKVLDFGIFQQRVFKEKGLYLGGIFHKKGKEGLF